MSRIYTALGLIASLSIAPALMLALVFVAGDLGRGPNGMANAIVDQAIEACEESSTCTVASSTAPAVVAVASY